ncbi:trigger factor [Candidatus Uhrbacteria bacterium RIFOXYB12_FULL_58_10]|nr:MAG: trigger factor [Candidatus Uhrbacteria bacterium RIFOXYB12_FULL_58_10]OGM00477.1 MAG: trigger factor [Candidatus Uhrbacteria bacterium RIFOXYC12_FULL_57_11]
MVNVQFEQLPKNSLKIRVTVPHDDAIPFLEAAALRMSEETSIPGFRPGKAGFEVVKARVGEQKIYEEALEAIVRKTFVDAVTSNEIETVGSPKIDVEKLAPGNDIVYTAEVALMPKISKLADWHALTVGKKPHDATNKDIELALTDLQRMQTKETRGASGAVATEADKVVVSMNMKKAGVPVEGGQSPNHVIYLTESYYVPGFKEQLVGMREGEEKSFTLTFPEEHTSKMLAGSAVEFEVAMKEIYNLEHPELDDAFASALGQTDMATLKDLLKKNIQGEKELEEKSRQEREILETLAKESRFDDIPDLLLNEEINKMIHELERGAAEQGMEFPEYMKSIKKTVAELKLEFTPQALTRIKVALILREIVKNENVEITDAEVEESLDQIAERYEDKEARDRIYDPEYRGYVEYTLKNRKAIEKLREAMVK